MRINSTLSSGRSTASVSAAMAVLGLFLLAVNPAAAERATPQSNNNKANNNKSNKKPQATTVARSGTDDTQAQDRAQKELALLTARLETGEFGPAVDAAAAIRDPGER